MTKPLSYWAKRSIHTLRRGALKPCDCILWGLKSPLPCGGGWGWVLNSSHNFRACLCAAQSRRRYSLRLFYARNFCHTFTTNQKFFGFFAFCKGSKWQKCVVIASRFCKNGAAIYKFKRKFTFGLPRICTLALCKFSQWQIPCHTYKFFRIDLIFIITTALLSYWAFARKRSIYKFKVRICTFKEWIFR